MVLVTVTTEMNWQWSHLITTVTHWVWILIILLVMEVVIVTRFHNNSLAFFDTLNQLQYVANSFLINCHVRAVLLLTVYVVTDKIFALKVLCWLLNTSLREQHDNNIIPCHIYNGPYMLGLLDKMVLTFVCCKITVICGAFIFVELLDQLNQKSKCHWVCVLNHCHVYTILKFMQLSVLERYNFEENQKI